MMRLVLVHGRGQGEGSPDELRNLWLVALGRGLKAAGLPELNPSIDVRLPFYGKLLDDLTMRDPEPGTVVARGPDGLANRFQGEFVLELAARAGITDSEISAEVHEEVVARKPENWAWVQAAARTVSKRMPWLGEPLLRKLTRDVHAYLTRLDVTEAVNKVVGAALDDAPAVVVGHSLGSIVAYWVLTSRRDTVTVPLLVTLGSPLGIDVVKRYLPHPLGRPPSVTRWLNVADVRDPIALYSRLDRDVFPAEIENLNDLHNPRGNPHGIGGYLADPVVARRITEALGRLPDDDVTRRAT
jgi:pimeloyl-ACP methyl ester carboxylesterase